MKKLVFLGIVCLMCLISIDIKAQLVTTEPLFPNSESPVTLIFDLTKSTDPRVAGLLNLPSTADVYLWSGAGSTAEGNAFQFAPVAAIGQTNFNQAVPGGKMTYDSPNKWKITLTPRTYYNVPNGTPIAKLGLLLKNTNGSAQTEDFIQPLFDNTTLSLQITSPSNTNFFVNTGENITINASSNKTSNLKIFLNNVEIENANNATSISKIITTTAGTAKYSVKVTANDGTTTVERFISFILRQNPQTASLPANTRFGVNYLSTTSARLAFLAPQKSKVYVIGDFNNWELDPSYLMKKDGETHWLDLTSLTAGTEYGYQFAVYDVSENQVIVADPFAELVLDPNNDPFIPATIYPNIKPYPTGKTTGVVSVLQTGQMPYNWSNATLNFQRPDKRNMVVYEIWVYDFNTTRDFQGVIDKLDYLKNLGVNAIEFMPVNEFAGNISWGYNPRFYCAVDKAYGTRNKFKELVDKAHQKGMAVIIDMVLNHAEEEYPYVKMYPLNSNPMYNASPTHPFNVFRDMNHDSEYTKKIVKAVNEYWINEYKIDGYRFDLSKGFTQNTQCANKDDVGCWNQYHQDRVDTWKRIADEIWTVDPNFFVILEHLGVDNEEEAMASYRANEGKGMLFWQNMEGNFARNIMGFNTSGDGGDPNISRLDFQNRGFTELHSVAYMESHDEERVMYKARQSGNISNGNHNVRTIPIALERTKAAAALLFSTPGPKMIWQFGELGFDFSINRCQDGSINNNCRLDIKPQPWIAPQNYDTNPDRLKLYKVFSEIIKMRTSYNTFKSKDIFIQNDQGGNQYRKQLKITPQPFNPNPNNPNDMNVLVIANFDVNVQTVTADFHHTGNWYHFFDGGKALNVTGSTSVNISLQPGEFRIYTDVQLAAPENELTFYVSPNAPTNLTNTIENGCQVKLNWTDASSIETGFKILRSTTLNGTYTQIGTASVNVTSFTDASVNANTTYFYKVVTVNNIGENESTAFQVNVPAFTAPVAPTNVTAQSPNSAILVNLAWSDNTDETGYRIQRSPTANGVFSTIADNLPANTTAYQDENVTIGAEYFYKVCALKCGEATCSNAVSTLVTVLENNELSRSIQIFPNPSQDKFQLTILNSSFGEITLQIVDVWGRKLQQQNLVNILNERQTEISIENLPKGFYFIHIVTDKGIAVKRFIKK